MLTFLWTLPFFPFAGFVLLALLGGRMTRREAAVVGVGSVGLSALATLFMAATFALAPPENHAHVQTLWTWMQLPGLDIDFALRLDTLSLLMALVVTLIGFLIHVYSTEYMADDKNFARFFACMNLFVAAMLTLVLADNLLVLFLGWEGVGLCSYLLIGFWYSEPANGRAARKAFIVTRIGDAALATGLFLLFKTFGTLDIHTILEQAPVVWTIGAPVAVWTAALLLGGALGKSGQLPLQVWLPDAMAGPTPVSALIHAATMVTAGVYLIARMHAVFDLAPAVQSAIVVIGTATLLLAGTAALVQTDIKRVLAYSTVSQIGYMFLALGVGAYSAGMFHFFTHAIFKALLFLGAGAIILALHHEQNMFRMGGLRKKLPVVFWTFLIGSASLAALPLVTAGFYSKDAILWEVWSADRGGMFIFSLGLFGAFLTAVYTFRMVFLVFFGNERGHLHHTPGRRVTTPLIVLAVAATVAGLLQTPANLGGNHAFSDFLGHTLPASHAHHGSLWMEFALQGLSALVVLAGIALAAMFWLRGAVASDGAPRGFAAFLAGGWGFDTLYDCLLVRPYGDGAEQNKDDPMDYVITASNGGAYTAAYLIRFAQNGRIRWYSAALAIGAVLIIYLVVYA